MTTVPKTEKEWRELNYSQINELFQSMKLVEKLEILENAPKWFSSIGHHHKLSCAELMQCYMNAQQTFYSCNGNNKANQNQRLANYYKELMVKYKIPIPSIDICFVLGEFNGKGSY